MAKNAETIPTDSSEVEALRSRLAELEAQAASGIPLFTAPQRPAGCKFWNVRLEGFMFHGEAELCVQADRPHGAVEEFKRRTGIIAAEFVPHVTASSEHEFAQQEARLGSAV